MKYSSDKNLSERYGVSRTSIWRWVHTKGFPQPIRLTAGCTRWRLSDVEAWEAEQGARHAG